MEVEQGTFTPLVFTTSGGMGEECKRYHNRVAEIIAAKKGEEYNTIVSSLVRCLEISITTEHAQRLKDSEIDKKTFRNQTSNLINVAPNTTTKHAIRADFV